MKYILNILYRTYRFFTGNLFLWYAKKITYFVLKIHKVEIEKPFNSNGVPEIFIHQSAKITIGANCTLNNRVLSNPIGRTFKCLLAVAENAKLAIGNNVGMSGTSIVCRNEISIGNYVKIGGNVCIYDTDFHSLNAQDRSDPIKDKEGTSSKKVTIGNHVFIGAHTTILKGVSIGNNSIVGACSLVTKDIPANEIWGGNPIKFIRKLV